MGPLRASIGRLDGAEQFLLEPVRGKRPELLIGSTESCQRDGERVDCLAKRVEQILPGFPGDVGHSGEISSRVPGPSLEGGDCLPAAALEEVTLSTPERRRGRLAMQVLRSDRAPVRACS